MKTLIAVAAGTLCLALAAPAMASPYEYNRGYHDCLAGRYDQEQHSHAYRQGCRDAEREQGGEPGGDRPPAPGWGGEPPRSGWDQHQPGWGGGGRPAGIPNVRGMDAAQVLNAMASRGYRNVGTSMSGAAVYGFYFNPATGECVQVANMNGRAVGAVPGSDSRCR